MTENPAGSCRVCDCVTGRTRPPGGVVWSDDRFVAYGFPEPNPIPGYVIVSSRRHVRGLYDLDAAEAAAIGPVLVRLQRAQKTALGADHSYVFVIGDQVPHFHAHVVPRFPHSPPALRGARIFQATEADARSVAESEAACARLAAELRGPAVPGAPRAT